jgi:hypothetical protein
MLNLRTLFRKRPPEPVTLVLRLEEEELRWLRELDVAQARQLDLQLGSAHHQEPDEIGLP